MTLEEKELLLRDLAARLPYGVKMRYKDDPGYEVLCQIDTFYKDVDGFRCLLRTTGPYGAFQDLNELKPYLRPMSSMTEEEYNSMSWEGCNHTINYSVKHGFQFVEITSFTIEILNWFNAHHFDYRKLIEKGLALEAPEGMY